MKQLEASACGVIYCSCFIIKFRLSLSASYCVVKSMISDARVSKAKKSKKTRKRYLLFVDTFTFVSSNILPAEFI